MDMVSVNFKIVFLIFSNKCCWFKLEMPQCVPSKYVFLTNDFFPISFFFKKNLYYFEHVEMNMYSCRLPRIWMTIIDCLFYAFDS